MQNTSQHRSIMRLLAAMLAVLFLLPACASAVPATQPPEPPTAVPPTADTSLHFSLDAGTLATGSYTETVPAVAPGGDASYWEVLPEHTRVTFQEYRIADHAMKPQIFIFPVKDLAAVNPAAGQTAATLQTLITSPQEIADMPFLPQMNMVQMMHANIQYLDFKTGQGLRYLTEFAQGPVPFNNHDLIYTYQGLTGDGKYYVAAILPINHPSLPADSTITGNEPLEFTSDPAAYKANVIATLTRDVDFFFPLLTELDAMLASMEIK